MKEANREVLDRGSLPELLVARARLASDRRLVLNAVVGLVGASGSAILRPPLWMPLTALAFCLSAYGIWGILDREVADETQRRGLRLARDTVAVMGAVAAAVFGISLLFAMLGRQIS